MKNSLSYLLAGVLFTACQSPGPALRGGSAVRLDPKRVPTELTLSPTDSVLLMTIEASDTGYRLISASPIRGVVNRVHLGGDDVVITSLGQNGRPVASTAMLNPRIVRTTGAKNPASDVLPTAVFSVILPKPAEIRSITIDVKRGPNAKLHQTLQVPLIQ
jgi:hypothetical protein